MAYHGGTSGYLKAQSTVLKGNIMSKITLYTVHTSRGNNVRWMLAECGADYDTVALDYS